MNHEPESTAPPAEPARPRPYADPRERYVDDPRRKRLLLAGLLALMPGLGHVYVGYYRQAFQNILVVCLTILFLSSGAVHPIEPPFGLFLAFFWLYNVVDAVRRASLYNQALAGLRAMDLPDDAQPALPVWPLKVGSLGGGIFLIVLGFVMFSHTMFDWSLEWIADWWPMALVGVGAWLVYEDLKARARRAATRASDDFPV